MITERFVQFKRSCYDFDQALENSSSYFEKLDAARKFYTANMDILNAYDPKAWAFSYPIDWSKLLNPIELQAWNAIRSIGRVILYPQFPVGAYTLDFGNPGLKIGLEIDGKQHDKARDRVRDTNLLNMGWIIYRVTAREMAFVDQKFDSLADRQYDDQSDDIEEITRNHYMNTGEGVIKALRHKYFGDELDDTDSLVEETLSKHILI
jgi:very-short-patch-repair endonuclease